MINKTETKKLFFVDDNPLFQFINPNSNDELSKMSGNDLQELIDLLEDYYLQLRSELGFDKYITFGLEIEFEHAMYDHVKENIDRKFNGKWITKHDGSLHEGAEINSPILSDNKTSWEEVDTVCQIISPLGKVDTYSGGHVHIGTQTLGNKKQSWLNFIKIWSVYENIIYRFTYGNFLTHRPCMYKYAEPMTKDFWRYYQANKNEEELSKLIRTLQFRRNQAVNFSKVLNDNLNDKKTGNTIEFRCPNSSFDPVIWQNNINLFINLLLYSKSETYNDDIVEARHMVNAGNYDALRWYDEVYLEQALELCDMLFDNNLDKVYFLKQYLKSFEVQKHTNKYSEIKKISKTGIKILSHN